MLLKNETPLSNLSIKEKELLSYFDMEEIIRQTIEQIKKDFDSFGLEIQLPKSNENVYQTIFNQIEPFILKLIKDNYQKLLQVLYRIDVSEKSISESVNNSTAAELSSVITKHIILRELQKVVVRNYYK